MNQFRPKRTSGSELVRRIDEERDGVPIVTAIRPPAPVAVPEPVAPASVESTPEAPKKLSAAARAKIEAPRMVKKEAEPVIQVNFRCSIAMFKEITRGVDDMGRDGSQRRFLAKLMRDAGYTIPDADIDPPITRRV